MSMANNTIAGKSVDPNDIHINETVFNDYPPFLLDFAAACCIIFVVLGVIGNLLSVLALAKCPKLRNATTAFIINLCVADFIFCCFSLPLSTVTFLEREWNYGETLCKLFPLFRYSNGAVSLFSVIAITINRYVLIVYPKCYTSIYKQRNIGVMIAVMWIFSLALLSLPLFGVWGQFGYDPKAGTCSILPLNGKSPKIFLYGFAFFIPSVVFIICYSRIFWVVRQSSRRCREEVKSKEKATNRISIRTSLWSLAKADNFDSRISAPPQPKKDRKELHVLRVMLVIFITFVICYFPVSFVKMLKKEYDLPVLNIVGYLTVYFSNCINPIIYVVASKEYRRAYFKLFPCLLKSKSGRKNDDTPLSFVHADSFKYVEGRFCNDPMAVSKSRETIVDV